MEKEEKSEDLEKIMESTGIPDILNLSDIAELLSVSKPTAKKLLDEGIIPGYKFLRGKYLVSKRQLIETIESKVLDG